MHQNPLIQKMNFTPLGQPDCLSVSVQVFSNAVDKFWHTNIFLYFINMSDKVLSFIPSSKGKEMAVVDQYMFMFHRQSGDTKYFRCTNWRRKCPARLVVYGTGKFIEN